MSSTDRPEIGDGLYIAKTQAYMDALEAENREYKATNLDLRRQITDLRNFHQKREAENRELDHQNSVLMMDLESCEEGGGEGNRQLRNRITELEGALREVLAALREENLPPGFVFEAIRLADAVIRGEQTTGEGDA